MESANCKRIPQILSGFRNIATFFDRLCCFAFHGQIVKKLYYSKLLQKTNFEESARKIVESATKYAESRNVSQFHEQIIIYVFSELRLSWNPQMASGIRICGIHLHLRNLLTFAESRSLTYIRSLRNPQKN